MTLEQFLSERKLSLAEFARRIGSTTESVRRYRNHYHIPTREWMAKIVKETGGLVTANDFYGIETRDGDAA